MDHMDDCTPIRLVVSPDGYATFDSTSTGPHVRGNTNAPIAITNSAIIYCLRGLVTSPIPLNKGFLAPIKVVAPKGTLLNPGTGLAVVGGQGADLPARHGRHP